jgi:hypothetical protein
VRNELVQAIEKRRNQALAKRDTHLRDRAPMQGLAKSRQALLSRGAAHPPHLADPLNLQIPGVLGSSAATTPRSSQAVTGQRMQAYSAPQAYESSNASWSNHDPALDARWRMSAVEALSVFYRVSGLRSIERGLRDLEPETMQSLNLTDAMAQVPADDRQSVLLEIDPSQGRWREEIVCWRELFADLTIKPVVRFKQPIAMEHVPQIESIVTALVRIADRDGNPAAYAVVRRAHGDTHWELLGVDVPLPDDARPAVIARCDDENLLSRVELVVYRSRFD